MASTFTTNTHVELQGTGDNSGTWGTVLNSAALTIIDNVFGAVQTITLGSVDVTLSTTQSQSNAIFLTGTLTASVNVIFPSIGRTYFVKNSTTGAFTVTLKTASAGVTIQIPQGSSSFYVLNVTDIFQPTAPSVPIGSVVIAAAAAVYASTGWLYCNGQAVSRTTYAGLFSIIGTTYGIGNGTTTFNVPDLRAYFVRGQDDGRGAATTAALGVAQTSANLTHTHTGSTSNQNADHTHTTVLEVASGYDGPGIWPTWANSDTHSGTFAGGPPYNSYPYATTSGVSNGHTHSFTTAASGGADAHPLNYAMYYMIKAF